MPDFARLVKEGILQGALTAAASSSGASPSTVLLPQVNAPTRCMELFFAHFSDFYFDYATGVFVMDLVPASYASPDRFVSSELTVGGDIVYEVVTGMRVTLACPTAYDDDSVIALNNLLGSENAGTTAAPASVTFEFDPPVSTYALIPFTLMPLTPYFARRL